MPFYEKILLLAFVIYCSSCSQSIHLSFSIPDGLNQKYKSTSHTVSSTQMMGTDIESIAIQNMEYQMTQDGTTPEGHQKVKLTYINLQVEQSAMGNHTVYDSNEPSRNNDDRLEDIYDKLINKSLGLIYDDNGQIIDTEGLSELSDSMFEGLPPESSKLKDQIGGESLIQAMKSINLFYPAEKVKKGSSWANKNKIKSAGMSMNMDMRYTFVENKNGTVKIALNGTIKTKPEEGLDFGGMQMQFDLDGTQTGFLWVDAATGWTERMELKQEMAGVMQMTSPQTGAVSMDMKIHSNQTIQKND